MQITVEIKGEKREIEAYLKTKLGMNFTKNAPKAMSKILKKEVDLTCASQESAICMSYTPQYTLSFSHYGTCKINKKTKQ